MLISLTSDLKVCWKSIWFFIWLLMGCLHDEANIEQTSSMHKA